MPPVLRRRHCWFLEMRGESPEQQQVPRTGVSVPLRLVIPRGKIHLVIAEVWHHLQLHERGHHRQWCLLWQLGRIVRQLAIAATGMAHEESIALIRLRKALGVGTVPEDTMADDAVAGAVLVGRRSNLRGERTAGAMIKIEALEAEEATQEAPTTVHEMLGQQQQQPWLQSSSELRDSQSQVTRQAELLFHG